MKNDLEALRAKEAYFKRWSNLKTERSSWMPEYREISENFLPRTGQFLVTDRNRKKHWNRIIDNSANRALNILTSGLMSGASSPSRPWFEIETNDPDLNKKSDVRVWLDYAKDILLTIFARSNTYRMLHSSYEELALYGTHSNIIMPNYDNVIHHFPQTCGQYCLATDYMGNVNTLYREFNKTVLETVTEFGLKNVSRSVQNMYGNGTLDSMVKIIHAIEPRAARDKTKLDAQNMEYASVYFEEGENSSNYLRESGFEMFRGTAPRWNTRGNDVYGIGIGSEALGANKQLQHEQRRKGQVIDLKTNPPLQVPVQMKGRNVERLPGGINYFNPQTPAAGIRNAYEVDLDVGTLREDIFDVRQMLHQAFHADIFLMMNSAVDTRMTATEVAERHEEKLLMLGPVLERLHNELLQPLVEITFAHVVEAGILPPPPKDLEGRKLNIKFVSMLAQAQKAVGLNSVERMMGSVLNVAQANPDVLDKVNFDGYVDEVGETLGVDPRLFNDEAQVKFIRESRAKMQAAQAQADAQMQQVEAASKMAVAQGAAQK